MASQECRDSHKKVEILVKSNLIRNLRTICCALVVQQPLALAFFLPNSNLIQVCVYLKGSPENQLVTELVKMMQPAWLLANYVIEGPFIKL